MDLIYNAMMASVKTPAERPGTASKGGESDKFQKLMDQKQGAKDPAAAQQETPQKTEAPVQESEAPVTEDIKELEKRMSQAAILAMAQNPIVADIAEETPQVLTDPSWEDGLVPVGYDDYDGYRIVHWMQPEAEGKNVEGVNAEAAQWMGEQNAQAAEEAPAPAVENETPELEAPVTEIKAETVETGTPEKKAADADVPEEAPAESPVFENVRAVPVKVGEAPAAQKTEEPVEKQIAPKLTEALRQGETRVELSLTPENLGKVTVEMTWKEDGGLVVQLHAENHRTQGLLERSASGLEALLSRESQQEVRVEVPRQEESQRQNFYDGHQGHDGHQQQERRQSRQANSGEDFLQQLRLGLIPGEED